MLSGRGPIPSRLMVVGEHPGTNYSGEECLMSPSAEQELNRMLDEVGIMASEVFLTNVCRSRPPGNQLSAWMAGKKKDITDAHVLLRNQWVMPPVLDGYHALLAEIEMVKPNLIIALGNLSMFALTGTWGILKWRGSHLSHEGGAKVIPTIHPSMVLKDWSTRRLVLTDLRRAKKEMTSRIYSPPKWNFEVRPTFETVSHRLIDLYALAERSTELWLDFDVETKHNYIDSIGISWSRNDALCIPIMTRANKQGYWLEEEEASIIYSVYKLLTHRNVKIRWQNGLYDAQLMHRNYHFLLRNGQDTMISQHSLFCALQKGLGFLGSMYADWYVYWKDEGKIASNEPEEQRWRYNLQDCVYTREVGEVLADSAVKMNLAEVDAWQQRLFHPVLRAMLLGVRIRPETKNQMAMDIQEELSHREAFLEEILGHPINVSSPKQMQALFYDDLKQKPIMKRTMLQGRVVMRPTCDDEALTKIAAAEPLIRPICNAIADIRTLGKFLGDFVMMRLDEDGRMRCSYNIAGDAGGKSAPYSYRLSSSKNPFGSGGNLQTIPSEKSKSSGKAAARGSMDFTLPNIRSMFGPDAGFTFFDMDLDRADLQVVVAESDDQMLKAAMRLGVDIHLLNVYSLDALDPPPLEELVETHPRYADHRGPRKHKREFAKVFCHATNYVGGAKTVAAHTGRGVHEIDKAQKIWFGAHPGIKRWHDRVLNQITRHRFVENRFGYRWYIFDRLDALLPEAVAWIPQSTVGIVINRAWIDFYEQLPEVQVLLQVHDSLAGQFPTHRRDYLMPKMQELSRIVIPYEEPLIIPTGVKTSTISWGDCA
ncbi:MAG: DNA polymerase I, thermostable [Nitrospira sp.]|nr:DNA polymerase I, thermostable [Nitrospira sp.]